MKKGLIFFILVLLFPLLLTANKKPVLERDTVRICADWIEAFMTEDYEAAWNLMMRNEANTVEKIKQLKESFDKKNGRFIQFSSYSTTDDKRTVRIFILTENSKVRFKFITNCMKRIEHVDISVVPHFPEEKAVLNVKTVPVGAGVYLNGVFQGFSPLKVRVNPGLKKLTVKDNGYEESVQTLHLSPGDLLDMDIHLNLSTKISEKQYQQAYSVLVNSFDRGGWYRADWVAHNIKRLSLSKEHVTQGDRSLKIVMSTGEPSEVIVQYPYSIEPKNLEKASILFLDCFWHSDKPAQLSLAFQTGDDWQWIETKPYDLKKGVNYHIPFYITESAKMDEVQILNIKLWLPEEIREGSIYFDNLRAFEK